jgi:hypothetical protein
MRLSNPAISRHDLAAVIAPHLGFADRGVAGVVPAAAVLVAEITILEQ